MKRIKDILSPVLIVAISCGVIDFKNPSPLDMAILFLLIAYIGIDIATVIKRHM